MKQLLFIICVLAMLGCTKARYENQMPGTLKFTTDSLIAKLKPSTKPLYYINDTTYTTRPDTIKI